MENDLLFQLTGLKPNEVGETLLANPRAYMSLKGAVAEQHLYLILESLKKKKQIQDFRRGNGDFEKDFYIKFRDKQISIECKNVEVIKITKVAEKLSYFKFLLESHWAKQCSSSLVFQMKTANKDNAEEVYASLPISLRESSLARYEYSAQLAGVLNKSLDSLGAERYVTLFGKTPLTIDFQRTRNARDLAQTELKSNRFYKKNEIDIVGACLFARTMKWEFIFCATKKFAPHKTYSDRFSNRLTLEPTKWQKSLMDVFNK